MKIVDVKGLILSETNYRDSSKILNVLTEEYGLIGILSKGCRNMKSKLRATSRKMIYGTFHFYYKENGLSTLISIDLINDYHQILMDLESMVYSSVILDLTAQVVKQTESKEILSLATTALEKIALGLSPITILQIVKLKYLEDLGVAPILDSCANCGTTSNIISLSPTAGGFICKDCYQNEGYYQEQTIQLIRMYYHVDIAKITKIKVKEEITKEIDTFLKDYYERYTGIYLKDDKMLKKIAKYVEV